MKSLKSNFLWNASYQLLLIITPLITTPYLSRVLGAQQVGVYSYTCSIASYFVMFATLGMSQYGVRAVASAGDDRALRSRTFCSAWAAQLCFAVPLLLLYIVYTFLIPQQGGMVVAAVWGLYVLSAVFGISWLFFGVEEFRLPTIRNVITKIAGIALIFLFVRGPGDLWIYVLSIAGAYLANALLLLPFVRRHVDFVLPTWPEVRRHFLPNLRLFAPVVAISLYCTFDKIMLGAISGMEQAGFYEYSEKLSKMPMAVITAMGTVMLPHMTAELAAGRRESAVGLLGRSLWLMEAAALGLTFGIAAISPEFAVVFLGEGYEPCAYIMPIVAIIIPIICASNVIGVQYMLPTFSDRAYTVSVCLGAVVNVALNLVLLAPFGAVGAAVSTVAAELAVLGFQCWTVRGELPLASYVRTALPFAVIGVLMFVLVRFAIGAFALAGVGGLIAEIAIGVVAYMAMAAVYLTITGRLHDVLKALR
jgi:O-antigen/teichoic acid export membrane protein